MNNDYQRPTYYKATKETTSHWHLYCNLYCVNIHLVVGQEKKAGKELSEICANIDANKMPNGFCFESGGSIIIYVREKGDLDTFVHELVHCVNKIFLMKGIEPDVGNDEPQAYLMSYLFRSFYKKV